MNNLVPWTVTHEKKNGTIAIDCVSAPTNMKSTNPFELCDKLGLGDGRVLSMVRGNHVSASIAFQRESYDE